LKPTFVIPRCAVKLLAAWRAVKFPKVANESVSPYSYNSSNELTSTPSATYTYDYNGNTKTKVDSSGTTTCNWDPENRLTSVVLPASGGTVSFKYEPFGKRIGPWRCPFSAALCYQRTATASSF
jgi:YD repeat-containing protein